jgi:hypothetical protein
MKLLGGDKNAAKQPTGETNEQREHHLFNRPDPLSADHRADQSLRQTPNNIKTAVFRQQFYP